MGSSSSIEQENNEKNEKNIEGVFEKAIKLKEENNWEKALELMKKLIEEMPSADTFSKMGDLFDKANLTEKAE